MYKTTGQKWIIGGYVVALACTGLGAYVMYRYGAGIPVLGKVPDLRTLTLGITLLVLAPAITSFFSGFAKLGQDILLSELPTRTFVVTERYPELGFARIAETRTGGRTYYVRLFRAEMKNLPDVFLHLGKGQTSVRKDDLNKA